MNRADSGLSPIGSSMRRVAFVVIGATLIAAVIASSAASAPEHPCKLHGFDSVKFVYGVIGAGPRAQLRVRNAQVICGGPDDEHWAPVGTAHTVRLAAAARIQLLPKGPPITPRPATLTQLARLTTLQAHDPDFGWFGGGYGARTNSSGRIESLTELYHP